MQALLDVILPVFLVIGFGYAAAWRGLFSDAGVDGVMSYTQNLAFPVMLFLAMARLDLSGSFDLGLIVAYYGGAIGSFWLGFAGARLLFGRDWADCAAIGFACMFANTLLLGIPITERAFGPDALGPNYAIVALNAPICYGLGLTVMELIRARGARAGAKIRAILTSIFRNALIIGIGLGVAVNISGLPLPGVVTDALDLIARSALPAALFAMGGVLYRYRPEGDAATIAMICAVSLVLHPAITWTVGWMAGLSTGQMRSAVLTAAMAPGVNAYIFASIYGVAKRVAASAVLIGTTASILSVWTWLAILP